MRLAIFLMVAIFLIGCQESKEYQGVWENNKTTEVADMKIMSNDFKEGDMIPKKFSCQGDDINPHLFWENAPEGTKSFALVVEDPDAPSGTFIHWILKDIPADVREIPQGETIGTEIPNSMGRGKYGGPCPPSGIHRYLFKLFALDTDKLNAKTRTEFYQQVNIHSIEETQLMAKYQKI